MGSAIRASRAAVLGSMLCVGVVGCAVLPGQDPKAVVAKRAQERWDAMVEGDFKKAYGYLSPGAREVTSLEAFLKKLNPGFWKAAKIQNVECEKPDLCVAHARITYTFQGSTITTPVREDWARIGNEWWYLQK